MNKHIDNMAMLDHRLEKPAGSACASQKPVNQESKTAARTATAQAGSVQRMVGPIPREQLTVAMMKDFDQRCIDAMTPNREYGFPMDNVELVISQYWPNTGTQRLGTPDGSPAEFTLSDFAKSALIWLASDEASGMTCVDARARIVEIFGSDIDDELRRWFKTQ